MSILRLAKRLINIIKGTILHPQWLTDRYHNQYKSILTRLDNVSILDIGSGNSRYSGIINSSNTLLRLDYPTTNMQYVNTPDLFGDVCQLPIKSKTLDVILFFEVLEHITDPESALSEIHRVLKPDGRLYFSVPFMYPVHDAPHDYRRLTLHGIRLLLTNNQFEIVQENRHGNSIITVLQLFNLTLLELIQNLQHKNAMLAIIGLIPVYPTCLLINLTSLIFLPFSWGCRLYFGYSIVATPKSAQIQI